MTKTTTQQRNMFSKQQKPYICINCGHHIAELYRKYSNTAIKTNHCEKCHKVADKYIEFDPIIILIDAILLSQESYRHMLHNQSFKLNWKLSLVLLLLESFALWRQKGSLASAQPDALQNGIISEKGFYVCCIQNLIDYLIITLILLTITWAHHPALIKSSGLSKFTLTLLKAITIANFSKIFLLPLIVWRENTTDLGAYIHHFLVSGHHLFALVYIYAIVGEFRKIQAFFIILPAYVAKEYIKKHIYVLAVVYTTNFFKLLNA